MSCCGRKLTIIAVDVHRTPHFEGHVDTREAIIFEFAVLRDVQGREYGGVLQQRGHHLTLRLA